MTSFEIAPGVQNTEWIDLKLIRESPQSQWEQGVKMFRKRINERYLEPIRILRDSKEAIWETDMAVGDYSGFAVVALECLLIETFYSFRTGRRNDYDRLSTEAFREILHRQEPFKQYFTELIMAETFYDHFRCGILHQGEVKSSGLIRRVGPLVQPSSDDKSLIINRTRLYEALKDYFDLYQQQLLEDSEDDLRENFIKKMNEICRV